MAAAAGHARGVRGERGHGPRVGPLLGVSLDFAFLDVLLSRPRGEVREAVRSIDVGRGEDEWLRWRLG